MNKVSLAFKENVMSNILNIEECKFVQLSLESGQVLSKQRKPHHVNLIVLSGHVQVTVQEKRDVLATAEMIAIEPQSEFELEATEKSVVLLVVIPKAQKITAGLDHENAYMNPSLIENVAPELRPLVEDHIEVCKILEAANESFDKAHIKKVLETVGEELQKHFVAEEELLFPRVAEHVGGLDLGPVARLIEEHKKIRRLHAEATERFEVYKKEVDERSMMLVSEKIKELSHALLNHLGKEDSHLFPMASRLMTPEELAAIAEGLLQFQ